MVCKIQRVQLNRKYHSYFVERAASPSFHEFSASLLLRDCDVDHADHADRRAREIGFAVLFVCLDLTTKVEHLQAGFRLCFVF